MRIKLQDIIPDPNQPRKTFNAETINELRASFDGLGLIQPITVKPYQDDKYMIIVGERRFVATKQRGDNEIECIVREDTDDKTAREMQFAENVQQENVPPLELGKAFYEHRKEYDLTQDQLAKTVGLSQWRLGQLEALHTDLQPGCKLLVSEGKLDGRTAFEISTIHDPALQEAVSKSVVERDLNRDTTAKVVDLVKSNPTRLIESAIAQVQYNIEAGKTSHRDLLNQYKRQQITPQPTPRGKYKTLVIDPPWPIEKILREVRPNQFDIEYPTMTIDEIMALPIPKLVDENGCHIYLWTTHKFLPTAFDILEVWGAKYQCLLTWVKNVGMTPFSWMYSTEHCLFARTGALDLLKMGKRLDFTGKVREHSRKPDEFYDLVKEVSPEPLLDMFSREPRDGFDQWGNEPSKFHR